MVLSSIYLTVTFVAVVCSLFKSAALDTPPQFQQHPIGGIVLEASRKILQCRALGVPQPDYRWLKNGDYLDDFTSNTFLRISSAARSDAGEYQCVARNSVGSVFSNKATLHVAYMSPFADVRQANYTVTVGQAVVMDHPPIDSYPAIDATWQVNGSYLFPSQKHVITLSNQFVILDSVVSDTGLYRLEALNAQLGLTELSGNVSLTVINSGALPDVVEPKIVIPPKNMTVVLGAASAKFECIANGRPLTRLSLRWKRNGIYLISDNVNYVLSPSRYHLTIKSPSRRHAGTFECEATLQGFTLPPATASAVLTIEEKPELLQPPLPEIRGEIGSQVMLPCKVSGAPSPTIHWYRNTISVDTLSDAKYTQLSNGSLVIDDLRMSISGVYQCIAHNSAGETSAYTWLKIEESSPEWVTVPKNTTALSGNDVRLHCRVTGAPVPAVTWKYNGTVINTSAHLQILAEGDLFIAGLVQSDSGVYHCEAGNRLGQITSSAVLTVTMRTEIIAPPVDTDVLISTTAQFQCGVAHDAMITVQWKWFHKDAEINPSTQSRHTIFGNGTLQITDVRSDDIGNYTCWVISSGGNDTRSALLTIVELPHPPTINTVVIVPSLKRTVNVSWIPSFDGNSPIEHYVVQKRLVSLDGPTLDPSLGWQVENNNVPADQHYLVVSNLQAASSYQFRVAAKNGIGEGPFSNPSTTLTLPQEPPGAPPTGVSASANSQSSIMVQWQQPPTDEWNGVLLGYMIRYKLDGYGDTIQWKYLNVTNEAQRNYLIIDLEPWKAYEIQMAAYNNIGVGIYSDSVVEQTLEGVPSAAPTIETVIASSSTSINVTWMPINFQSINGVLLGYKIMANKTADDTLEQVESVPPNYDPTSLHGGTVSNLSKYTEYKITVLGYTKVGDGPPSAPSRVRTLEDVPAQVGSFSFYDIQDTRVSMVWSAPDEINGILTGYNLLYQETYNSSDYISLDFSPYTFNYTAVGLQPVTEYTFTIAASTIVGTGLPTSATIKSGVPPKLPGPPTDLRISNVSSRSALLSFVPGYDGETSITLWTIEGQIDAVGDWSVIYEIRDPEATAISVNNLRPFTTYKLRIIAGNVVGNSAPSIPSDAFETLEDYPEFAPSDLIGRAVDAFSITLRWTPLPDTHWNGIPRGYNLTHEPVYLGSVLTYEIISDPYTNSFVLKNLEAFTAYRVQIAAYNNVGSSPFSGVTEAMTRESTPSAGPSSVNATTTGSRTIMVDWSDIPGRDRNGVILGYKIHYGNPEIQFQTHDVPGNSTRHVLLQGLRSFVTYTFMVLGYTRVGDGVLSNPTHAQTYEDVPGPPTDVFFPDVTYTTAIVTWNDPLEPNGHLTGYKIEYWLENLGEGSSIVNDDLGPNVHSYSVNNLQREQYYIFRLSASTRLGWGQPAIVRLYTISNRGTPDAPRDVTVSPSQIESRSATVSWRTGSDGYSPIRYYTIQLRTGNNQIWNSHPDRVAPDVTSHTVTGLYPNTDYSFRMQATNDKGVSPWSDASSVVKTLIDKPSLPPSDLKVFPITQTSVQISWDVPPLETWNGERGGYQILHKVYLSMADYMQTDVPAPDDTMFTLDNLLSGRDYEIKMLSYNSVGKSSATVPVILYVGEAAPTAPPESVKAEALNSTAVHVQWHPPPEDSTNGDILGYRLFYSYSADNYYSLDLSAATNEQTIGNLPKYTIIDMQILVYNFAGVGPNSTVVQVRTHEDIPGPPGAVSFSDIMMTSLIVSWLPPPEPNGELTGYKVVYWKAGISTEILMGASNTSLYVHSLLTHETYTFHVSARTSKGYGSDKIANVTTGPQPGSPSAPGTPLLSTGDSSVTLTWSRPATGGWSNIIYYLVEKQDEHVAIWELHANTSSTALSYTIAYTTLKPGTKYNFRVIAVNGHGISEPSAASEFMETPTVALAKFFYEEPWFLVIVALSFIIIVILLTAFLCHRGSSRKRLPKSESTLPAIAGDQFLILDDSGGFAAYELDDRLRRQITSNGSMRNQKSRTSGRSQRKNSYTRTPPRPSPGSVTYFDEDDQHSYPEPDDSSVTDRKSNLSSGDSRGSETETDSDQDVKVPPDSFVNHYANAVSDNPNWQPIRPTAYSYTDSDASQALNSGGHIVINNMAGSRAPLPGFSSFV